MNKRQRKKLTAQHLYEAETRAAIATITQRYVRKGLAKLERWSRRKGEASRLRALLRRIFTRSSLK